MFGISFWEGSQMFAFYGSVKKQMYDSGMLGEL